MVQGLIVFVKCTSLEHGVYFHDELPYLVELSEMDCNLIRK